MLACPKPETFPLRPACVVLRFTGRQGEAVATAAAVAPATKSSLDAEAERRRLYAAAQAFLLRVGS